MGKAKRKTDLMDVIKHSQKLTKKAAGMKRQLASGTAYTHRSAMAATKTLGSSAGGGPEHNSGDLEMHTYDIKDVDRLYFAVTAGSSDRLESQATGIEAASYLIDVGGTLTQFTFGMNFQIPLDSVTKPGYLFKIGSGTAPVQIKMNIHDGADLILTSNVDKKSCLKFDGIGYGTSSALPSASIYFDGTDIMAEVEAGTVNLTSGGSGPTLGGTNSWTGANTFTTYVVMPGASSGMPASTFEGASDGYFRIKHGADIKNVPYWDE
jgi:hypothetical protein